MEPVTVSGTRNLVIYSLFKSEMEDHRKPTDKITPPSDPTVHMIKTIPLTTIRASYR
ncbi:hypothetical protein NBRC116585_00790 [Thalassolituus maritimus]|uniref:Uncharacterized protein n=1 Tax=Thalassolituus maritimus TaxID=484498 RepID=A0ABP9ZV33_9GAMM